MRSYYEHLGNLISKDKEKTLEKPTFRSSAIFPVIHYSPIRSRILFMGYWMLKRNIKEIGCLLTLRSLEGQVLYREYKLIDQPKAYRIELSEILEKIFFPLDEHFWGSLEIEFFSAIPLVFPFPAVTINFYSSEFSSVVHTAQRVYNDEEDKRKNTQTQVAESGFNIYAESNLEPFFSFINGPENVENDTISMLFFNSSNEQFSYDLKIEKLRPYETLWIYPARLTELQNFLKGKVGSAKIRFHAHGIFPRLVVGNISHTIPAMTMTHTYYDCTAAQKASDYWLPTQDDWYAASLMIPLPLKDSGFTNLYFYPIYTPSLFCIDVEIYTLQGKMLGKKENVLCVGVNASSSSVVIRLNQLCEEWSIPAENLSARIIAKNKKGQCIPARIKVGLDIGDKKNECLACNICVNLQPFNPQLEQKPLTFKWAPLLSDQPNSSLWVMNSSPRLQYDKHAEIQLTFFREQDGMSLKKLVRLAPHASVCIMPDEDKELSAFLGNQIGWCTISTDNPYTTAYYFSHHHSGVVGGDHSF